MGLEGWTIFIDEDGDLQLDPEELADVTDDDGFYLFDELPTGLYTLVEQLREGWEQTWPASTLENPDQVHVVELLPGGAQTRDFGNRRLGSIEGVKFFDSNADGIQQPEEEGLEGWTIFLDEDGDRQLDPEERFEVTDEDGAYLFDDLSAKLYTVVEVLQPGWQQTFPPLDVDNPDQVHLVDLLPGESAERDFGNQRIGSISGFKFNDLNVDGVRQPSEEGLGGWRIFLDGDGDFLWDAGIEPAVMTDADGGFEFSDLPAADYVVVEEQQEGWLQTAPALSEANPNQIHRIALDPGEEASVLFGNSLAPRSVAGTIVADRTGNGFSPDDGPLPNVAISLYRDANNNQQFDRGDNEIVSPTTSDSGGYYRFPNVPEGFFFVVQRQSENLRQTDGGNQFPQEMFYSVDLRDDESSAENNFANAAFYPTGYVTRDMVAANLDGNAGIDFAVVNGFSRSSRDVGSVVILSSDGMGGFVTRAEISVDDRPHSVTAGDLDGDGDADLVVTLTGQAGTPLGNVLLLFNDGNGFFGRQETLTAGGGPIDAVISDWNADGQNDLAVANFRTNNVSIFIGAGQGAFQFIGNVAAGDQPVALTAGSFNSDAGVDLAVANFRSNDVTVLTNDGTGRFSVGRVFGVPGGPSDIVAAQLDGDGILDVAITNSQSNATTVVFAGLNGLAVSESTRASIPLSINANPKALVAVDFDDDTDLDLAVAEASTSQLTLLSNDGDRNFFRSRSFASAGGPESIVAADINNDDLIDLASTALYRVGEGGAGSGGVGLTLNNNDFSPNSLDDRILAAVAAAITRPFGIDTSADMESDDLPSPEPHSPPSAQQIAIDLSLPTSERDAVSVVWQEAETTEFTLNSELESAIDGVVSG